MTNQEPVAIHIPGTLECPPMTLTGPVVTELPSNPNLGDLATYHGVLFVYVGGDYRHWVEVSDETAKWASAIGSTIS